MNHPDHPTIQGTLTDLHKWTSSHTFDMSIALETMKRYLFLKIEQGDWHGASDACNDIREMLARK